MNDSDRKITISIDPPLGSPVLFDTLEKVKEEIDGIVKKGDCQRFINGGDITLSWFDDMPTSQGVAVTVAFSILEGVDLARDIVIGLRKIGFQIRGVHPGY